MVDWNDEIIVDQSADVYKYLTKSFTWSMFPLSETVDGYAVVGQEMEKDLASTVIPILLEDNVRLKLHLSLIAPDVKAQQMIKGSSVGGMYCCGHCYRHRAYFGNYVLSVKGKLRDWLESMTR